MLVTSLWTTGGQAFQAEGTTAAKALRSKRAFVVEGHDEASMAAAERKGSEPGGEVGRAAGPDLQGLVVPADGQRGCWPSLK